MESGNEKDLIVNYQKPMRFLVHSRYVIFFARMPKHQHLRLSLSTMVQYIQPRRGNLIFGTKPFSGTHFTITYSWANSTEHLL